MLCPLFDPHQRDAVHEGGVLEDEVKPFIRIMSCSSFLPQ